MSAIPRLLLQTGLSSIRRTGSSPLSPLVSFSGPGYGATCGGSVVSSCYQSQPFLLGGVRFKYSKKPNITEALRDPEAVEYHGFVYFPRKPGDKDPPIEPAKLFKVKRIRSLYGCPYWEKKLMIELKLADRNAVAILKNTPKNNKMLYTVKHLIEIIPITTPNGMPDSPDNGFLKENGEFVAYNLLGQHGNTTLEEAEQFAKDYYKEGKGFEGNARRAILCERWYSRYNPL